MSYLLAISIGPVQDFIAAARRTADLYAGSQMLQELCQAAAQALEKEGAKLIFPWSAQAGGANKILAELGADPKTAAEKARQAAQGKLLKLWEENLNNLPSGIKTQINHERAKAQLEGFLEFYAAWVPFDGNNYPKQRKEVDRLLAGRKALRDFNWVSQQDEGIPKSPLDPSRATVLELPKGTNGRIILSVPQVFTDDPKLRLNKTEFLDAISLLKRVLGAQDLSGKVPQTRTLARMATNLAAKNADNPQDDLDDSKTPVDPPYFAILRADGDKMGELIDSLEDKDLHTAFSGKLSRFAHRVEGEIRGIVYGEQRLPSPHPYRFCVYSGGDDTLAFLPVNKAIACAKALAEKFKADVGRTLSVGIAIVHYREPLSISLEAAREAEKAAKNKGAPNEQQGDRLAVALHTRGGAPITVVRQWGELKEVLDWDVLVNAYKQKRVSRGMAYELAELAKEWKDDMDAKYLQAEAERIRKRKEGREITLPTLRSAQDLKTFADQLVIARFLSGLPSETPKEEQHA